MYGSYICIYMRACVYVSMRTHEHARVLLSHACMVAHTWTLSSFWHPCTKQQQLKFYVQPLLDGLCKWAKYQVRFWPNKPDQSLVSKWSFLTCFFLVKYQYFTSMWRSHSFHDTLPSFDWKPGVFSLVEELTGWICKLNINGSNFSYGRKYKIILSTWPILFKNTDNQEGTWTYIK